MSLYWKHKNTNVLRKNETFVGLEIKRNDKKLVIELVKTAFK